VINLIPKANTYHPKRKMIQRHFYWHGERWVLVVKRRCTRRQKVVSTSYKVARVMQASTTFFLFSQRLNCLSTNVIIAKKNHWKSTKKKPLKPILFFWIQRAFWSFHSVFYFFLFSIFIQISNCPLSFLITEKKSLWKDGKSHWGWFYFFFCFQRHFSIFICLKKLNKKIFKHSDNILMINESFKKI
jgi:hypothetical protein